MKSNFLSNIFFIILAILILGVGFLLGTFILTFIFIIIIFMSCLFVIMWLFNNLVSLFKSKVSKQIFKTFFSILITYGLLSLFWLFTSKYFLSFKNYFVLIILWVITTLFFGTLWYLLHIKKQKSKHSYLWEIEKGDLLTFLDLIIMLLIPSIIVFVFNFVHLIV